MHPDGSLSTTYKVNNETYRIIFDGVGVHAISKDKSKIADDDLYLLSVGAAYLDL